MFTTSNDGVLEIMSTTDNGVQTGVVTIDGQMNEALGEAMIQAIVAQLV